MTDVGAFGVSGGIGAKGECTLAERLQGTVRTELAGQQCGARTGSLGRRSRKRALLSIWG